MVDILSNYEAIAQSVLNRVFEDCIPYPIDPLKIAKNFNVPVFFEDLDDDLSGCFIAKSGEMAIVLNNKYSKVRQRFTLAHELGHFIYYKMQDKAVIDKVIIDKMDMLSAKESNKEEIFANKFAAALLMPKKEFTQKCIQLNNTLKLARYFDLSKSAIEFKINNI